MAVYWLINFFEWTCTCFLS